MTASSSTPPAPRLALCADLSRAANEDPIATAPHWQELTVLELDVPVWARLRDVANWTPQQSGLFERLRGKVEASGAGFGLLMSAPPTRGAPLAVRHYVRAGGGYARRDYVSGLPQDAWADGLIDTLLEPERLAAWTPREVPAQGADLHVCTHGTVDAACGRYGVPVYQALVNGGERGWRTGHFGGHRLAATAVELPSGLLWAHLTPELALKIARREGHPADYARYLRGYSGLPALAQVVDRELFVRRGWSWLDADRQAEVRGEAVHLTYRLPGGGGGEVWATVRPAPSLHLPGSSHAPELSEVRQYRTEEWHERAARP